MKSREKLRNCQDSTFLKKITKNFKGRQRTNCTDFIAQRFDDKIRKKFSLTNFEIKENKIVVEGIDSELGKLFNTVKMKDLNIKQIVNDFAVNGSE
jgi:hypothetical protein